MRPDAPAAPQNASPALSGKESSVPSSPAAAPAVPAAPATRPRLNLAKRTVSQAEPSPASATPGDSKASPFGAARPIDTAAREKEIEEKLRVKKEQDEKAREEKKASDDKAKEEKRQAKNAERDEKLKERRDGPGKESEQGDNAAARNYQILRRDAGDEANGGQDEDANGEIIDDKGVKPREIVKDMDGSGEVTPTTEAMDEDGWSTVSKAQKGRKGGVAPRALAS
jgi:translation initiation factor 4B